MPAADERYLDEVSLTYGAGESAATQLNLPRIVILSCWRTECFSTTTALASLLPGPYNKKLVQIEGAP
jgi:hypothetical protein